MSNVVPFERRAAGRPDLAGSAHRGMLAIVLASAMTGTGKTMLAAHLAVEAGRGGDAPVGILDTDPKGSLTEWFHRRHGGIGQPAHAAHVDMADLAEAVTAMAARGCRLCFIDTPSGPAEAIAPAIEAAGLVIVPSDADPGGTADAVALARDIAGRATVAFVTNGRSHSGEKTGNALAALGAGLGWPAGMVRHADLYPLAMTAGRTVGESQPEGYAAADIAELWATIRGILVAG